MVISMEAASVHNVILHEPLTSKMVLDEPEIIGTDPNIPIESNITNDGLHFEMPGGCCDYQSGGVQSNEGDAVPTSSWQRQGVTQFERVDLGTSCVDV
jgi:hypothetical protein